MRVARVVGSGSRMNSTESATPIRLESPGGETADPSWEVETAHSPIRVQIQEYLHQTDRTRLAILPFLHTFRLPDGEYRQGFRIHFFPQGSLQRVHTFQTSICGEENHFALLSEPPDLPVAGVERQTHVAKGAERNGKESKPSFCGEGAPQEKRLPLHIVVHQNTDHRDTVSFSSAASRFSRAFRRSNGDEDSNTFRLSG